MKYYVISFVLTLGIGIAAWFYLFEYQSQLADHEIPIIKARLTPIKKKPENPGGMKIPNLDKTIYDNLDSLDNNKNLSLKKKDDVVPSALFSNVLDKDALNNIMIKQHQDNLKNQGLNLTDDLEPKKYTDININILDNYEHYQEIFGLTFSSKQEFYLLLGSARSDLAAYREIKRIRNKFKDKVKKYSSYLDYNDNEYQILFGSFDNYDNARKSCQYFMNYNHSCKVMPLPK